MLVSENSQFFEGASVIIENNRYGKIAGNANCYRETLEKVADLLPDIMLIDLDNPISKYSQLIATLRKSTDTTKILMVGPYHNSKVVFDGIKAGAVGFISQNDLISLLPSAIMHILHGRYFLSPPITTMMVKRYLEQNLLTQKDRYSKLTNREKEILLLIGEGYGSRVIADLLNISVRTVSNHRSKINHKLDIHTTGGLIKYAIKRQSTNANS